MMKTKKRRMEYISFYNHTGLEKHFTKMAKKGWLIESISNYYWTYRAVEPQDMHFCVTYYPRASDFDPEPSEEQQTFHDFCAHTGWQLACTWHQMQVFYNEKENPIPLETDPVLEVETLHKACKKNYLPSYYIFLILGLIMGGYFIARILADPIGLLSSSSNLLSGFAFACLAVISIVELAFYFTWYSKAKKAAKDGIFVDTPSTTKIQMAIMAVLVIALAGWFLDLFFADDPIYLWVAVLMFAYYIALIVIVNSIKQGLKKAKASRGLNKALTIIACFVLSFVMMDGVVWLTMFVNRSGFLERNPEDYSQVPLSLADLTEINEDAYIAENRIDRTVLLGQQVVYQSPHFDVEDVSDMPDLGYTVTIVKVPFLYDWCKNQIFNTSAKGYEGTYTIEYLETDATPWGAEEAYRQLDEFGEEKNSYLVCYKDRFVLIHFDWEPTGEQMEIVRQKLNP